MKITFVAWISYHRRSDLLAQHLGANMRFINYKSSVRFIGTPIRYLVQSWQTWQALLQDRPNIIFVQNPPIISVLVAYLYARLYRAEYVIDSHTGAFLSPKWRWSVGLHRFLSKRALTTIVHNTSQEKIVAAWGCRYMVIAFTPGDYPPGVVYPLSEHFNVAVVSSFREDEPVRQVFEAAALLPDVRFYVTGNPQRLASSLLSAKPDNCLLTGYLSNEQYIGLLRGVDAIMVLTTGEHTLLMGGFEAVSIGTPLIVSDSPLLRDYFSLGTVHVANTAEGICEGVCQARDREATLKKEIPVLQKNLQTEWECRLAELKQLLHER